MAIVNAAGGGVARKSADNKTYRMVRGRIIMSRKRDKSEDGAETRGVKGNIRKPLFAMINMFMTEHASDIEVSFNKSKYGSQRNYFFSKNYSALSKALNALAQSASVTGTLPAVAEIEEAITSYATEHPNEILRVRLTGFQNVYLSGAWTEADNPVSGGAADALGTGRAVMSTDSGEYSAPIAVNMNFKSGARVVRPAGQIQLTASALPAGVTANDIQFLATEGNAVGQEINITNVVSAAGSLSYNTGEITQAMNVLAIRVKDMYIRLTSAYVKKDTGGNDPLG